MTFHAIVEDHLVKFLTIIQSKPPFKLKEKIVKEGKRKHFFRLINLLQ